GPLVVEHGARDHHDGDAEDEAAHNPFATCHFGPHARNAGTGREFTLRVMGRVTRSVTSTVAPRGTPSAKRAGMVRERRRAVNDSWNAAALQPTIGQDAGLPASRSL